MKQIKYLVLFLLLTLIAHSQKRNSTDVFSRLATDTKNAVATENTKVQIVDDTVFVNEDLYYIDLYFNSQISIDSISHSYSDTILYRTHSLTIKDPDGNTLHNYIEKQGFFWKKGLAFDESVLQFTINKTTDQTHCWDIQYPDLHNATTSRYICYTQIFCDLANNVTNYWCSFDTYTKVFQDNFEGNQLDEKQWKKDYPWGGQHVNEDDPGTALPENAVVSNGTLKLYAKYDASHPDGRNFSYGTISTLMKFGYGKYEIRAKIPHIYGVNPAFWLNSGDLEIDCFEFFALNRGDLPSMTVYSTRNNDYNYMVSQYGCEAYSGKIRTFQQRANTGNIWNGLPALDDGNFHIFTVVWDPNYITWWVSTDDQGTYWYRLTYYNVWQSNAVTVDPNANCSCTGCTIGQNINFPNATGNINVILGNGIFESKSTTGGPSQLGPDPAGQPSAFEIDWIKVYSKDNCSVNTSIPTERYHNSYHGNQNDLTADIITLGGAGDGTNAFKVYYLPWDAQNPNETHPENQILSARANTEIRLLNGFEVEDGAVFKGSIAYNGEVGGPPDCQTLNYWPQYMRNTNPFENKKEKEKTLINEPQIELFPNPAENTITIKGIESFDYIEILNSNSQKEKTVSNNISVIDIEGLTPGLHFLKIICQDKIIISKFIKL